MSGVKVRALLVSAVVMAGSLAAIVPVAHAYQPGYPIYSGITSNISGPNLDPRSACYGQSYGGRYPNYYSTVVGPQFSAVMQFFKLTFVQSGSYTQAWYNSPHSSLCYAKIRLRRPDGVVLAMHFVGYAFGFGANTLGTKQESRTCQNPESANPRYC